MDISPKQKEAMLVVQEWVRTQKTPMPKKELFKRLMVEFDMAEETINQVIRALLKNGYIRRAAVISNKTFYVQLRSV